jgi:hypothetical protein
MRKKKNQKKRLMEVSLLIEKLTNEQADRLFDIICNYADSHGAVVIGHIDVYKKETPDVKAH